MLKLGTQTGSLINHLMSAAAPIEPKIGMGATVLAWSDRYAGTIVDVRPDGSFTVREDHAARTDGNGMSDAQSYAYSPNEQGREYTFAPVKRGKAKGQLRENGRKDGNGVIIDVRDKHHDFSF